MHTLLYVLLGSIVPFITCAYVCYVQEKEHEKAYKKFIADSQKITEKQLLEFYKKGVQDLSKHIREALDKVEYEKKRRIDGKQIIIEKGNTGILADGKHRLAVAGIEWPKDRPVFILENHQWSTPPLGQMFPIYEDGDLKAILCFNKNPVDLKPYENFYPSVGGRVIEEHKETIDGEDIVVIDKFELYEVSLSISPNADPSIKTIKEQLNLD